MYGGHLDLLARSPVWAWVQRVLERARPELFLNFSQVVDSVVDFILVVWALWGKRPCRPLV